MRYVANRILHVTPKGSEERTTYRPGDEIPGFDAWPHANRKALLDSEHVKFDFDPDAWVKKDDADGLVAALDALGAKAEPRMPAAAPALPVADAAGPEEALAGEDETGADTEFFDGACDLCPRSFASPRALKQHRTKAHGGL